MDMMIVKNVSRLLTSNVQIISLKKYCIVKTLLVHRDIMKGTRYFYSVCLHPRPLIPLSHLIGFIPVIRYQKHKLFSLLIK